MKTIAQLVVCLVSLAALAQADVYESGVKKGRATKFDFRGAGVSVDGGFATITLDGGGGGASFPTPPVCGLDAGSALGWDGGAFYCEAVVKPGSCSGGEYVSAISATAAPTCSSFSSGAVVDPDGGTNIWHSFGSSGEPGFQSGWNNYDITAYGDAGFRMEANGRVFLRGLVKSGTVSADCSASLGTLPVGFRPMASQNNASISSGNLQSIVGVNANGNICINTGSSSWITLNGINFSTVP